MWLNDNDHILIQACVKHHEMDTELFVYCVILMFIRHNERTSEDTKDERGLQEPTKESIFQDVCFLKSMTTIQYNIH